MEGVRLVETVRGERERSLLVRYGPPAALLIAGTVAVLLVRAGLDGGAAPPAPRLHAVLDAKGSAPARRERRSVYVIRAGDTLEAVARRFGTTVERLLTLNPGIEPTSLPIGQRIHTVNVPPAK